MKLTKVKDLQMMADVIREDTITSLIAANSGHSAGPLGMADIFTAFYFYILNHDSQNPLWEERDRLILSNGHITPIRYAAMAHAGYFSIDEAKAHAKEMLGNTLVTVQTGDAGKTVLKAYFAALRERGATPLRNWDDGL